jgi:HlyD family secretion protein
MTTSTRRRIAIWSVLGAVALAALVVAMRPAPVAVDQAVLAAGPMRVTIDHEGLTRVRERFVVSAPLAGRVLRIELEPGDRVERGRTVLATLLPAVPGLLDVRTRAEATSRIQAAGSALDRARAERDQAQASSAFAASEARRARLMVEQGLGTRQSGEAAVAEAAVRARAFDAAEAAVAAASHDLEAARAMLVEPGGRSAAVPSQKSVDLTSPIDGVVLRRIRQSEAVVAQGEPLVEVADPSALEVIVDFLSTDAVRMKAGMPVLIDRWGGASPLAGRIRRIEPAAFLKVSALGVEEQRVWVVVELADPPAAWAALGDGFRVEARVVTWERADALQIPTSALIRQGEGWAALVIEGGLARMRPVTIGHRNGVAAELLGGLKAGDHVIVHPPDQVADLTRVALRQIQSTR